MRPPFSKEKKLAKKPRLIHFSEKVDEFILKEAAKPNKTLKGVIEERILFCMKFKHFPPQS